MIDFVKALFDGLWQAFVATDVGKAISAVLPTVGWIVLGVIGCFVLLCVELAIFGEKKD
ncbi:hypothetical protein [Bifidobacterium crudilactis]|jgi:hypothetical protein|uniref:Uncharacterized protein n=1 Tax=Bifidobacterium crudilactis TaxID=327277 RepID=A0A971CZC9_9BIFI|nr:hypothetical protein [Bifidobacterium crudilactis]MCI1868327.1 hypothetical protein [Bifidobacterium crudilactis]MDN5972135.1 hypothetical protein [Bifidobacterium crudilactis]MDN6000018.1 hypothetical protein [Bifidobacterium crudilactis]MDN6210232.1 hypothetical protein [Bifidobacterium crudilactis]MDN6466604.1 hypothetical protein [Bifidobacterium crudilactis]